jgi:hypothetical protein
MPEEITDQEREELKNEKDVRKKKEMTAEEILECPTWDCDGGPEIVKDYTLPDGREVWMVWCPVCKGWVSRYIAGDDPYGQGARIWEEMRRGT